MKNRGFLLVEALVMFVILSIFFFFVYRTAANYLQRDRINLFHDDIATLYQGHYMTEMLFQLTHLRSWLNTSNTPNINTIINPTNQPERYARILGLDTPNIIFLQPGMTQANFEAITQRLNLHQILLTNNMNGLRACARNTNWNNATTRCQNTFMDEELRTFISSINIGEITTGRAIIYTFRRSDTGGICQAGSANCFSHFTWVAL